MSSPSLLLPCGFVHPNVDPTDLHSLGLQIAQTRPYLHTLGPKVGIIYIHGALGIVPVVGVLYLHGAPGLRCYAR